MRKNKKTPPMAAAHFGPSHFGSNQLSKEMLWPLPFPAGVQQLGTEMAQTATRFFLALVTPSGRLTLVNMWHKLPLGLWPFSLPAGVQYLGKRLAQIATRAPVQGTTQPEPGGWLFSSLVWYSIVHRLLAEHMCIGTINRIYVYTKCYNDSRCTRSHS